VHNFVQLLGAGHIKRIKTTLRQVKAIAELAPALAVPVAVNLLHV